MSHRFQIISHLILILLLICFAHFSYMMAAAFPGLSPDLRLFLSLCRLLINFLLFTAFLCIIHLISYCFPLLTSCYYLYHCTRVNRSFHSSGRFFLLQCTGLSTGVERYRCRQKTGQTHYIFYYILVCNFLTILLVINMLSFANVDYFPYLYKIY